MVGLPDPNRFAASIGTQVLRLKPLCLMVILLTALVAVATKEIYDQEVQRRGRTGAAHVTSSPVGPIPAIGLGSRDPDKRAGYNRLDRRGRIADEGPHVRYGEHLHGCHAVEWLLEYLHRRYGSCPAAHRRLYERDQAVLVLRLRKRSRYWREAASGDRVPVREKAYAHRNPTHRGVAEHRVIISQSHAARIKAGPRRYGHTRSQRCAASAIARDSNVPSAGRVLRGGGEIGRAHV